MLTFDGRSAYSGRLTGWERYAGELADGLRSYSDVNIVNRNVSTVARRLSSDLSFSVRRPAAKGSLIHFPTFPPMLAKRMKPFGLTVHDLTLWKYPETASFLGKSYYIDLFERAIPEAEYIVTPSEAVAKEVANFFGRGQVIPVPLGCDALLRYGKFSRPRRRPYFVALGSIEPRKNLDRLIKAFRMSGRSAAMDLIVVGRSGWGDMPVQGAIHVGHRSDAEVAALISNAEALLMPSLYEGFGLPVVEALALGTPVLCSDIPVFREITRWGGATFFNPEDLNGIATALAGPLPSRLEESVIAAYRAPRRTWSHTAARLYEVMKTYGVSSPG